MLNTSLFSHVLHKVETWYGSSYMIYLGRGSMRDSDLKASENKEPSYWPWDCCSAWWADSTDRRQMDQSGGPKGRLYLNLRGPHFPWALGKLREKNSWGLKPKQPGKTLAADTVKTLVNSQTTQGRADYNMPVKEIRAKL